jgi:hypothetical protein
MTEVGAVSATRVLGGQKSRRTIRREISNPSPGDCRDHARHRRIDKQQVRTQPFRNGAPIIKTRSGRRIG